MKRLVYISRFSRSLTLEDLEDIGIASVKNNTKDNLTGALFTFKNMFYQILEGDDDALDNCYQRIAKDDRHKDVFCLEIEKDVKERLYGAWEMKPISLGMSQEVYIKPIRTLLNAMANTHNHLKKYLHYEVLRELAEGKKPEEKQAETSEEIIIFSDLFSFTTITEYLTESEILEILNQFYRAVTESIIETNGTVGKLLGDGLLAYYEVENLDMALLGVQNALKKAKAIREAKEKPEHEFLNCGVGMAKGRVLKCNIGSDSKRDYTVIGDAVNIASRLESLTRQVGHSLVFDKNIANHFADQQKIKKIAKYIPTGKTHELEVFTIEDESLEFKFDKELYKEKIKNFKH